MKAYIEYDASLKTHHLRDDNAPNTVLSSASSIAKLAKVAKDLRITIVKD